MLGWGTVAAALVALTGCATAVAGTGSPGEPSCLPAVAPAAPAPPSDPPPEESEAPAGRRVIAVDVGLNMWIASSHTSPLYLTVYEDGTVIRSEDAGAHDEPLPALTIGRIDDCVLDDAVARLVDLAGEDMGDPGVSDQGTTRVYVWPDGGAEPLTISAYALGLGDEYVEPAQAAARGRLSATINGLAGAMTEDRRWIPDRLRVTWFRSATPDATLDVLAWPLADRIADYFPREDDAVSCAELSGAEARALRAALGRGDARSRWDDGGRAGPAMLVIGVLMPGQEACRAA